MRFHKKSDKDGSGKADAYFTGDPGDHVWGVVFEIDPTEKRLLDRAEGVGHGYAETEITVIDSNGQDHRSFLYMAQESHIDPHLKPYLWYKRLVVEGARQHDLPREYVAKIEAKIWIMPAI